MSGLAKRSALLLGAVAVGLAAGATRPAARPAPAAVTFERYHGYAETKAILDRLAATYPDLARVSSIGKDYKGTTCGRSRSRTGRRARPPTSPRSTPTATSTPTSPRPPR